MKLQTRHRPTRLRIALTLPWAAHDHRGRSPGRPPMNQQIRYAKTFLRRFSRDISGSSSEVEKTRLRDPARSPDPSIFVMGAIKDSRNNVVREMARRRSLLSRHACIVHTMPSVRPRPRRPVWFSACRRPCDYPFTALFQSENTLDNQRGQIQMYVECRACSSYVNITDTYMSSSLDRYVLERATVSGRRNFPRNQEHPCARP